LLSDKARVAEIFEKHEIKWHLSDLFLKHSTCGERFAHLLATWYQQTGTLVCESLETTATSLAEH